MYLILGNDYCSPQTYDSFHTIAPHSSLVFESDEKRALHVDVARSSRCLFRDFCHLTYLFSVCVPKREL